MNNGFHAYVTQILLGKSSTLSILKSFYINLSGYFLVANHVEFMLYDQT